VGENGNRGRWRWLYSFASPFKTIELCILKGSTPLGFVNSVSAETESPSGLWLVCAAQPGPPACCVIGLPRQVAGSCQRARSASHAVHRSHRGLQPFWAQRCLHLLPALTFSELGNGKGRRKESAPHPPWEKDGTLTSSVREWGVAFWVDLKKKSWSSPCQGGVTLAKGSVISMDPGSPF